MCTAVIPPLGGAGQPGVLSLSEINLGYRRPCAMKELMRVRERGREEQKEEGREGQTEGARDRWKD